MESNPPVVLLSLQRVKSLVSVAVPAMAGCINYISMLVNCGYAKVSIHDITSKSMGNSTQSAATKFQALFPTFNLSEDYFQSTGKNPSRFDTHCGKITKAFGKVWYPAEAKEDYLAKFATAKWKLSLQQQAKHSLSQCAACRDKHFKLQQVFPLKPVYDYSKLLTFNTKVAESLTEREFTQCTVTEVNDTFEEVFDKPFSECLLSHCKNEPIERKKTSNEKRKEKRAQLRELRDHINVQFAQTAALSTLSEDESLKGYQRKRKAQSFETPSEPQKKKSHSPSVEHITWDTQKALDNLREWPQDQRMNWSKFAREHGIPGKNGGQVIKEYAENHGIDVVKIDGRTPTRRVRASRKRLPGNEISTPANPTPASIKQEWAKMIQSGKLTIGETCAPYKLTRFIVKNGVVESMEVTVFGRKIPLAELRLRLLRKQKQYMRLFTGTELQALSQPALHQALACFDATDHSEASDDDLRQSLAHYQRHRHLLFWHDHATILGAGFLMITVNILYDPAVFFTNQEYEENTPHLSNINIQAEIE